MEYDFYNLTYNNVIIATSYAMNSHSLNSLYIKLNQNPKLIKDLIRHKRVIVLPENDNEAQKIIKNINQNNTIGTIE